MEYPEYRHFYGKLSLKEKALCSMMYDGFMKKQSRFRFDLEGVNADNVLKSIWRDFPELYFVDTSCFSLTSSEIYLKSSQPFLYTDSERREIDSKLDGIVRSFFRNTDDFTKELAVHNYLAGNSVYDRDFKLRTGRSDAENHSMIGPLVRGIGVCSGIAKAAQYILTRLGVYSVYCVGDCRSAADPSPGGHGWLIVRVNGQYYHLDMSHDVCRSMDTNSPSYGYFNVTDSEILLDHRIEAGSYSDLRCTCTEYNYYRRYGRYYTSLAQLQNGIVSYFSSLPAMPKPGSKARFDFKLCSSVPDTEFRDMLQKTGRYIKGLKGWAWTAGAQNTYLMTVEF